MARILVADVEAGQQLLKEIVGGRHSLDFAETMPEAEKLLQSSTYNLIVIGVNFDESRAFECLRMCKGKPEWRRMPVVFFGHRESEIGCAFDETMQAMARTFGYEGYIDRAHFEKHADPKQQMLCELERYLPKQLQTEEACIERGKEDGLPTNLPPEDVNEGPWT